MTGIQLREHQVDQKTRFRKWVMQYLDGIGFPARSSVPAEGARAMITSATGSGKTYMIAAGARECFPGGRILVMVPTLDLLVQTAQAWRRIGHNSPMVAVCSLAKDEVLEALDVRTTTNPIQLALWAGRGPVVVFATYASLVDRYDPDWLPRSQWGDTATVSAEELQEQLREWNDLPPQEREERERAAARWLPEGVTLQQIYEENASSTRKVPGPLEAALAGGERLNGQRMNPFDLAVVDEAHGTAGDLGRPWAAIHDNNRIPADFRLYLTATPRILAAPRPHRGKDGKEVEIASMVSDPDGTYGERIADLGLSEAIERGILAGFEIDVLEIRDPDPILGLSEEALRGRRLALLQTALLEHAAAHDLHTVMTFHQRVEEAEAFAAKLPQTAAELYRAEASETALPDAAALPRSSMGAEPYELEPFRHVPPDRVWAAWLCGDHLVSERRKVIHLFANGIDDKGRRVHRAFLCSVRVLGEGVDITGLRGVEAICFADTRGSQVEIMQNIGRALRPNPDGTTKVARIIVPVFLSPGEDPDNMIASSSYKPLVAVLQGLRSHDERLVEQLASRALTRGQERRRIHVRRDPHGNIVQPGKTQSDGDGEEEQDGSEAAVESALLHFASPRDPATIAAFLRTRVYRPDSLVWLEGYQALRRWRAENRITGLYAVPYDTEVELGVTTFPLGRWVHQQRRALRAGELEDHRRTQLDDEGMVWEPGDEAWETKLAALRSYHRAHGHLAPRQDAVWGEGQDVVPVGQHMANLRRKDGLGKDDERAEQRAKQLAEIDPDWDCSWPLDWQRHYRVLADLVDADGALPDIPPGSVHYEGDDLGKWIERQQNNWTTLTEKQQQRLTALGIAPAAQPAPLAAGKGTQKASAAFQRGVQALAQYIAREGHFRVPRAHAEEIAVEGQNTPMVVKLGVWISNTKSRRDKLAPEQRAALAELGVEWA